MGAPGFEPGTSPLSGVRSSQLSYAPNRPSPTSDILTHPRPASTVHPPPDVKNADGHPLRFENRGVEANPLTLAIVCDRV